MKVVVTKDNFKKVLGLVGHVVGNAVTLPILSNILLQTDQGRVKISATNLELGVTAWLGGRVEEEGSITLPARTISEYVATTPGDQLELTASDGTLSVSTESSSASIKTLPSDEFPLIPKIEATSSIAIAAGELKRALSETLFATAPLETQPELAGIYVYIERGRIYFVTTDRYRLSEASISIEGNEASGEFKPIVIPHKTALEAVRVVSSISDLSTPVTVVQGENQVLFRLPDIELVSRLIDGKFPDYKEIIPTEFKGQAIVSKTALAQAVKSAGLFAAAKSIKVRFKPSEGSIEVYAASGDIGESAVQVAGTVTGEDLENVFNHRYLTDYLNTISDDKVFFGTIDENSPAIVRPESRDGSVYMVMPVKA